MTGLSEFVRKGVRLIVTESDEGPVELPPSGPKVETPREIPAEDLAVPEAPAVESALPSDVADFAAVYAEAGVSEAPHGYGVNKVAEMLANPRLASLGREVKAAAVLAALEAAGVTLAEVIQDAVRRDRAIDAFESAKRQELDRLEADNQARLADIDAEIRSFLRDRNAQIEELKAATKAAQEAFASLLDRKHAEEERLRDIVCHFVAPSDNPITAPSTAPPAPETSEQAESDQP